MLALSLPLAALAGPLLEVEVICRGLADSRHVLLIEDMGGAEIGSAVLGTSPDGYWRGALTAEGIPARIFLVGAGCELEADLSGLSLLHPEKIRLSDESTSPAERCLASLEGALQGEPLSAESARDFDTCREEPAIKEAFLQAIRDGRLRASWLGWRPLLQSWGEEPEILRAVALAALAEPTGPAAASLESWMSEEEPFLSLPGDPPLALLVTPACGCPGGPGGYEVVGGALILRPERQPGEARVEALQPGEEDDIVQVLCGCGGEPLWRDPEAFAEQRQQLVESTRRK